MLNDRGTVAETITNKNIVGPWDMAVSSTATSARVFISNPWAVTPARMTGHR